MTNTFCHLSYEDRIYIEQELNNKTSIYKISKNLNKPSCTIYREVKRNAMSKEASTYGGNAGCKNRHKCNKKYCNSKSECFERDLCPKLSISPYLCNGCNSRNGCRKEKNIYYAKPAQMQYDKYLVESRFGVNLTPEEIHNVNIIIAPLLKEKNQTVNHIYINHPELLPYSKTSFYKYVDLKIFDIMNIDLPRQVTYKQRKSKKRRTYEERQIRINRTYKDFLEYIEKNPNCNIVELDCVEGIKGGKVMLTLLWRKHNFMLIFLLEKQTQECVREVFDYLQQTILEDYYNKMFEVILTDNGHEFLDALSIENDHETEEKISHLFYCDPSASYQKGALEKNHEFIRYILPKGSSFDDLTQNDCYIIANHINSLCRESLNNQCPFKSMLFLCDEYILNAINMYYIEPDMVTLNDSLIKK